MIHNLFTVGCAQMKRDQNFIITPALDHNLVLKFVQAEYIQLMQIQLLKYSIWYRLLSATITQISTGKLKFTAI